MKKLVKKDKQNRLKFKINEQKCKIVSYLAHTIKNNKKLKGIFSISFTFKKYSLTRIQNRCIISGRSKGILRKFKLSRMLLKRYSDSLKISGLKKQNN